MTFPSIEQINCSYITANVLYLPTNLLFYNIESMFSDFSKFPIGINIFVIYFLTHFRLRIARQMFSLVYGGACVPSAAMFLFAGFRTYTLYIRVEN